jgi:hypothetical protein
LNRPALKLAFQLGEIGDFAGRGAKAREQRQTVHA